MIALKEITQFLEELYPPSYAEEWDNIGLLVGREGRNVSKAVVCLDCNRHVVREAVREGAELIITHHPVIFNPIKSITDSDDYGTMLLEAIEGNISIYSAHTNLDSVPGGLCDLFAEKMGIVPFLNLEGNIGRLCHAAEGTTAKSLIQKIKKEFNIETLYSTFTSDRAIKTVAVCNGGGGGSLVQTAKALGADVYISGDLKHHEISSLRADEDIDFIQISHYDSEMPVCTLLKEKLSEEFGKDLDVLISSEQPSPLIDTDNIV